MDLAALNRDGLDFLILDEMDKHDILYLVLSTNAPSSSELEIYR